MTYKQLEYKINSIEITCEEDLEQIDTILEDNSIKYKYDIDCVYDSCGYDVYAYVYAFVYDGEIRLIWGTYGIC